MSKYDKMIELNRERSVEKVAAAKAAIQKMAEDGERISVPRLMKMTGLSRGFFYKNPSVRQTLDKVLEQQGGVSHPRKNILDMAMNNEILSLQKQIRAMQQEMDALRQENEKLKKALDRKNRELLRNL